MNKTRWFGLRPHLILEKKRKNVCLPLPLTAFSTHEGTTPRVLMSYCSLLEQAIGQKPRWGLSF